MDNCYVLFIRNFADHFTNIYAVYTNRETAFKKVEELNKLFKVMKVSKYAYTNERPLVTD